MSSIEEKESKLSHFFKIALFFFGPYKGKILLLSSFVFIAGLLEALNLLALYPLINYGLEITPKAGILKPLSQITIFFGIKNLFLFYCYMLIVVTIITVTFKAFSYFLSYNTLRIITKSFYKAIFEKYITVDYVFFVNNQQGKLIHTGTVAVNGAANLVEQSIRLISDLFRFLLL